MAPPNVCWITLDSVRSDHTALDGYERDTTPTIARLAEAGAGFRNCFAHSKDTLQSSGAILTGYPPTGTTVGVDGNRLPDEVTTVAERFRSAGYDTACLSRNSYVSAETGLDRGFDRFQWLASSTIHQAGPVTLLKYLLNIRNHSAGFRPDTAKHASPFLMNEVAKGWLDDFEGSEDPFFFYLHYNEPHRPYYPPGMFLDAYADDLPMSGREAAELATDIHYRVDEIIADGCHLSEEEWAALLATYDAEIAYTDYMVGQLLDHLDSLDLGDTVVVVTADHGELFGEWGLLSHKYVLDDAVTRVPMVVHGLDEDLAAGDDDLVQHADVMATLLSVAGADADDLAGVDLRSETREFAVSQRGPVDFEGLAERYPGFDPSKFRHGTLSALRTAEWKYQRGGDGSDLFELPDEDEGDDVRADHPDRAAEMDERLDEWFDEHGRPRGRGAEAEFSDAVQEQLEELGYMS